MLNYNINSLSYICIYYALFITIYTVLEWYCMDTTKSTSTFS